MPSISERTRAFVEKATNAKALPYVLLGAAGTALAVAATVEPAFAAFAGLPGVGAVTTAVQNGSGAIGVAGAIGGVGLHALRFQHDRGSDWTEHVQGLGLKMCGGAVASNCVALATLGGAGALLRTIS